MTQTTIAIIGATGNVGKHVTKAILAKKYEVKVLVRDLTDSNKAILEECKSAGAKVVKVDVNDKKALTEAFKGVTHVVSCVASGAIPNQSTSILAAKDAGVKYFYPSEYGVDDVTHKISTSAAFQGKAKIREEVVNAGLTCVSIITGFFLEWALSPFYSFDFEKKTVQIFW
jgi:uncharacterized protein YbjT (DUF2867 family)